MMTENEIFERIRPLLKEVLGIAPEKIRQESLLVADLGAESIDLLDLSFLIEETFNVTIEGNEIEREAGKRLSGGVYEKNGRLTDEALAEIRKALPELDASKLVKGIRRMELPTLLTVQFFVKLIARKLAEKEGVTHA
jgi:acyl carrier protein